MLYDIRGMKSYIMVTMDDQLSTNCGAQDHFV